MRSHEDAKGRLLLREPLADRKGEGGHLKSKENISLRGSARTQTARRKFMRREAQKKEYLPLYRLTPNALRLTRH